MDIKRFKMLHFNNLLFNNLNSVFGMTQESFSMDVFNSPHKYKQRLLVPDRLLVIDLVQLCNHLHMSISHFFTIEPVTSFVQEKSYYVIKDKDFIPITFNNGTISDLYGKKGLAGKITRDEIAAKLNITSTTLYLWARKEEQVKVSSLLQLCNQLNVPISLFLDDRNKPLVEVPKEDEMYLSKEIMAEIKNLQSLVSRSQKEIRRLKEACRPKIQHTHEAVDYQEKLTFADQACEERFDVIALKSENKKLKDELENMYKLIQDLAMFAPAEDCAINDRIKEVLPEHEA